MLELKANKLFYLDGVKLNENGELTQELLMSFLNYPITLDKDLTIGDFIHVLYEIRDFITLYCAEEYEILRALVGSGKMVERYDYLRIFKNAEITSDDFFKMNVQSNLESYGEFGSINKVCDLKIILDQKIIDGDEILREGIDVKADFTLLEIIEVLYEDFLYSLTRDNILN